MVKNNTLNETASLAKKFHDVADNWLVSETTPKRKEMEALAKLISNELEEDYDEIFHGYCNTKRQAFWCYKVPNQLAYDYTVARNSITDEDGSLVLTKDIPPENWIKAAEYMAQAASYHNLTEKFRSLVPNEAKTEQARKSLIQHKAYTFASLCI